MSKYKVYLKGSTAIPAEKDLTNQSAGDTVQLTPPKSKNSMTVKIVEINHLDKIAVVEHKD